MLPPQTTFAQNGTLHTSFSLQGMKSEDMKWMSLEMTAIVAMLSQPPNEPIRHAAWHFIISLQYRQAHRMSILSMILDVKIIGSERCKALHWLVKVRLLRSGGPGMWPRYVVPGVCGYRDGILERASRFLTTLIELSPTFRLLTP